jgi:hypothetical protein
MVSPKFKIGNVIVSKKNEFIIGLIVDVDYTSYMNEYTIKWLKNGAQWRHSIQFIDLKFVLKSKGRLEQLLYG